MVKKKVVKKKNPKKAHKKGPLKPGYCAKSDRERNSIGQYGKEGQLAGDQGRPKGSKAKMPRVVKDLFLNVLEDLGGEDFIEEFALKNKADFVKIIGKMLPKEVNVSGSIDIPTLAQLAKNVAGEDDE